MSAISMHFEKSLRYFSEAFTVTSYILLLVPVKVGKKY